VLHAVRRTSLIILNDVKDNETFIG